MAKTDTDEVSLLDLILGVTLALRRNLYLSIFLILAGLALSVATAMLGKTSYESTMVLETSLLSENECRVLVTNLEHFRVIPGMTVPQARTLKALDTEIVGEFAVGERGPLNDRAVYVNFKARTIDKELFPTLQTSLFNYFNNSPAALKHRAERDRFYSEVIQKLDHEIAGLEQVKKDIDGKTQATYLNPSDLFSRSVELFKEKTQLQIKREQIKNMLIMKEFKPIEDTPPNLIIAAAIGLLAGVGLVAIVLFLKYMSKLLSASQNPM